jgi:hypothetical protein
VDIQIKNSLGRADFSGPDRIRQSDPAVYYEPSRLVRVLGVISDNRAQVVYRWIVNIQEAGLIAMLATGLSACALPKTSVTPTSTEAIKLDLPMRVNNTVGHGAVVVPRGNNYKIKVFPPDEGRVFFSTCHRDVQISDEYEFTPTPIESASYCPAVLSFLGSNVKYVGGFIDFQELTDVEATLNCNGGVSNVVGVGFCQSRATLVQNVLFKSPVNAATQAGQCPPASSSDQLSWNVKLGKGHCVYAFKDKQTGKYFRLTTFGYEAWRH